MGTKIKKLLAVATIALALTLVGSVIGLSTAERYPLSSNSGNSVPYSTLTFFKLVVNLDTGQVQNVSTELRQT